MSSILTAKLSVAIFIATLSTAACGLLAVTAVGEQTGATPTTQVVADASTAEPAASVNLASQPSTPPASVPATAAAAAAPAQSAVQAWPATETNRVQQALRLQMLDVSYNAMPLQQVMAGLADDFNIGIQIDRMELENLGFGADAPVTLGLPPIPLSQALDYILTPLGMSYRVEGDVLLVSSREKLNARPSLRVYDMSIFETPDIAPVIEQNIRKVQPDYWTSGQWSIDVLDENLLFISASDPAHAEIELLLTNLARQLGKSWPQPAVQQAAAERAPSARPQRRSPAGKPGENPFGQPADPFGASANPFGD